MNLSTGQNLPVSQEQIDELTKDTGEIAERITTLQVKIAAAETAQQSAILQEQANRQSAMDASKAEELANTLKA